jgi:DNA-binding YbaB/EbfC family protein
MRQLNQIMQQAQQMQKKMEDLQNSLAILEVDGASGAGLVKATVNGKGELKKIKIDKSLVDPNDVEILEDLIIAAFNDAKSKSDAQSAQEMAKISGDLKLPNGMKLPF